MCTILSVYQSSLWDFQKTQVIDVQGDTPVFYFHLNITIWKYLYVKLILLDFLLRREDMLHSEAQELHSSGGRRYPKGRVSWDKGAQELHSFERKSPQQRTYSSQGKVSPAGLRGWGAEGLRGWGAEGLRGLSPTPLLSSSLHCLWASSDERVTPGNKLSLIPERTAGNWADTAFI
jgi:hypothetical protein